MNDDADIDGSNGDDDIGKGDGKGHIGKGNLLLMLIGDTGEVNGFQILHPLTDFDILELASMYFFHLHIFPTNPTPATRMQQILRAVCRTAVVATLWSHTIIR